MSLKQVYEQLEHIASVPGRIEKENLISNYINDELFRKVVYYAIEPSLQFKTKKVVYQPGYAKDVPAIFQMLDYLAQSRGASDQDKQLLSILSSHDEETLEVITRIINKDLRIGASISTFEKHMNEISKYLVMLCEDDLEKFNKVCPLKNSVWSEKLDGVRNTAYCSDNDITYLSRNGKEFTNFKIFNDHLLILKNKVQELIPGAIINFDGEVEAVVDKKDKNTFDKLMGQVRRLKDLDPSIFRFSIFDLAIPNLTFAERYNILIQAFNNLNSTKVRLLPHYQMEFDTILQVENYVTRMVEQFGWEGIVIKNPESFYEFKRSRQWCKVKKFYTSDCPVIRAEFGTGRNKHRLGKLICLYNGKEFGCGSGFTDNEREEYINNPPMLIEVKYQEITKDGVPRFPTFVKVREDK